MKMTWHLLNWFHKNNFSKDSKCKIFIEYLIFVFSDFDCESRFGYHPRPDHPSRTSLEMSELMRKINLTPTWTDLSPVKLPTIKYHIRHLEKCCRERGERREKCPNPFVFFHWREVWFTLREIKVRSGVSSCSSTLPPVYWCVALHLS